MARLKASQEALKSLVETYGDTLHAHADHPLFDVYMQAIAQVAFGKGERHGGSASPFMDQSWKRITDAHGVGWLTGQAAKKIEEAITNTTRNSEWGREAWEREILGAIAYLGMAYLFVTAQELEQ